MKPGAIIASIIAAIAVIAGIIYVVVAYGDKIAAWFKKVFSCADTTAPVVDAETVEQPEEAEVAEEVVEAVEEISEPAAEAAEEAAPVAEDADFVG